MNEPHAYLKRRANFAQRPIEAYAVVPTLPSASIEAGRPYSYFLAAAPPRLHAARAGTADFVYYTAQRITVGDELPLVSVTETSALPLAYDTLRRSYEARGPQAVKNYKALKENRVGVRWYAAEQTHSHFASGITPCSPKKASTRIFCWVAWGLNLP